MTQRKCFSQRASSELGQIKTNPASGSFCGTVRSNNGKSMRKELLGNSKHIPVTPKLFVCNMIAGLFVFKASVELVRGEWERVC